MKLTEDGSDVFSGGEVSKQSGSRVLYKAIQNAFAIVESASDDGVD